MDRPVDTALPRRRDCAAIARRFVEHELSGRVGPDALDDIKLIASELVQNAYLHGRGAILLKLHDRGRHVRVEVIDEGHGQAVKIREQAGKHDLGGYGLRVVEQLAHAWGAHEGTTHVWAEISAR